MNNDNRAPGGHVDVNGRQVYVTDDVIRQQQFKDSQSIDLIAHKVSRLATDMSDLAAAQARMAETVTALVRIEERQILSSVRLAELANAGTSIELRVRALEMAVPDDLDKRMAAIETKLPSLIESRMWLIAGFAGMIALLGTALIKGVFR